MLRMLFYWLNNIFVISVDYQIGSINIGEYYYFYSVLSICFHFNCTTVQDKSSKMYQITEKSFMVFKKVKLKGWSTYSICYFNIKN